MVNVTIDGCAKTSAGGTVSEWFTLIATIAAAVLLTMSRFFKQDRNAIMGWLLGVLVLSMLLGGVCFKFSETWTHVDVGNLWCGKLPFGVVECVCCQDFVPQTGVRHV